MSFSDVPEIQEEYKKSSDVKLFELDLPHSFDENKKVDDTIDYCVERDYTHLSILRR